MSGRGNFDHQRQVARGQQRDAILRPLLAEPIDQPRGRRPIHAADVPGAARARRPIFAERLSAGRHGGPCGEFPRSRRQSESPARGRPGQRPLAARGDRGVAGLLQRNHPSLIRALPTSTAIMASPRVTMFRPACPAPDDGRHQLVQPLPGHGGNQQHVASEGVGHLPADLFGAGQVGLGHDDHLVAGGQRGAVLLQFAADGAVIGQRIGAVAGLRLQQVDAAFRSARCAGGTRAPGRRRRGPLRSARECRP